MVFRAYGPGPCLWESLLPPEALRMPAELARVDELLDDPAMLEPFLPFFDPRYGRRSIPMETFVRLMFLKYRYRLGFETLCREVTDSVSWRRFCRVPLDGSVPDHSTLKKIAQRCGPAAIEELNEALLAKAADHKVLRTDRVRADTTVVPANVGYPTDSGLLARGVIRMVALVAALHGLSLATRTQMRDRSRSVRRRAHDIGAWLRRRGEESKEETLAITAQMADIAEASLAEARRVAANARRGLRRAAEAGYASERARATLEQLEMLIGRLERVVAQTRLRVAGGTPESATRLVSLHDPDARPIKKGRIGKPVEFGYLAQVLDNEDGIIVDHSEHVGNPFDGSLLAPAVGRVTKRSGRAPRQVAADRGYGAAAVDSDLTAAGVRFVAIVRKGRQSQARQRVERGRRFRNLIKWRTGSEGRISALKRNWGWGRCLMDGHAGVQTWCGYGVFAHNAVKISGLIAAKNSPGSINPTSPRSTRTATTGTSPPGKSPPWPLPLSA
jgi:transposase, IS5 family